MPLLSCADIVCTNGGSCEDTSTSFGGFLCLCPDGFVGELCEGKLRISVHSKRTSI